MNTFLKQGLFIRTKSIQKAKCHLIGNHSWYGSSCILLAHFYMPLELIQTLSVIIIPLLVLLIMKVIGNALEWIITTISHRKSILTNIFSHEKVNENITSYPLIKGFLERQKILILRKKSLVKLVDFWPFVSFSCSTEIKKSVMQSLASIWM